MSGARGLFLASTSPRRRDLLAARGLTFSILAPDVDEDPHGETDGATLALRLASLKGAAVCRKVGTGFVIAADTVVAVKGAILGKPTDAVDARRMLSLLSGTQHTVTTGFHVARVRDGRAESTHDEAVTTRVTMRHLAPAEIAAYVASGESDGKAGAYAIQETGDRFVVAIDGPYDNVVGLPVDAVMSALAGLGFAAAAENPRP